RLDPPSPAPWRCFDLGRATARLLAASPWRVALIASSSWSHAFLTPKHHLLYPDVASDRAMYETLRAGDYEAWRQTPLAQMEDCDLVRAGSVYHGSPLGAIVIPKDSLPLMLRPSVIAPSAVIRAMLPATDWANHTEPSGDAAMPSGPVPDARGNSVTWLVDGS